jgi:hypothetical protein
MPVIPHKNTEHMDGLQTDEFWLEGTLELMRQCDAVLLTPDWERSSGARGEKEEALRCCIPVFYGLATLEGWLRENRDTERPPAELLQHPGVSHHE